ncbi:hypothetical protein [Flavobacterium sp. GSA192]|uniref:hypothetical protein n=1 Tax=Flavobacterium sp. GSA192 TaxID=2576304 RepID=UPI0021062A32|nr:hypothetical protein [Flavobacterium sp. GSA192]
MRNFTIYLVLFLCLFVSKINAQETYKEASEKFDAKRKEIIKEEEIIFSAKLDQLKVQQKNGVISKQEFKKQKNVLEKKRELNIKERDKLNSDNLFQQFPEMGAKSFEGRAFWISQGIKKDVREEKELLKKEVEEVDKQLIEGVITKKQAEEQKLKLAGFRAKTIEEKVSLRQEALKKLIQDDVDSDLEVHEKHAVLGLGKGDGYIEKDSVGRKTFVVPAMKVINSNNKNEKRSTSQFVLAFGANNLITNNAVANSDFSYWKSRFFEWGFTYNTRIFKNYNLLHLKYGFSVMYNNIRPTDNRYYVTEENQTNLEVFPSELKNSRFKNVYLVAPIHLEFDFSGNKSKSGNSGFSTHKGFRLGVGGYLGTRMKTKQKLYYNNSEDEIRIKTKDDFNTNDFIYGLSTYIGYKATSLYLKYDLNPLFKDNSVKQNNVSLGLRFDFN